VPHVEHGDAAGEVDVALALDVPDLRAAGAGGVDVGKDVGNPADDGLVAAPCEFSVLGHVRNRDSFCAAGRSAPPGGRRLLFCLPGWLAGCYFPISPIHQYLISMYSSIPYFEPSRPNPDCFMPPKGATSVDRMPVFTATMPYSSASPTRHVRPRSRV